MALRSSVIEALPPLAWLLEIDATPDRHRLICGTGVARTGTAFFEGAWPGTFAAMDFTDKAEAFGSGGVLGADGWTIVPPSHTLEAVFCCRDGSKLFFSNALPFLLAHRGDALDPGFLDYHRIFFDILNGIDHSPIRFPSRNCKEISGYYHANLVVGTDLALAVRPKPLPPHFATFADYRGYLAQSIKATLDNAADPRRPQPYRPVSTISRGYDSPTCAALAREAGCRATLTHGYARRAFGVKDPDSGAEIAQALGMEVTETDRGAYLDREGLVAPEAEFLSHGLEGMDVNQLAFEPQLKHCVLFTGFHGDAVWDKHAAPNPVIRRGDLSGGSLGEFRRRVDFIHLPLPFVGALRHGDVVAISNAAEMQPYSVGGGYDRPIPRRILEEARVPRGAFGQSKKATTIDFFGFQPGLSERLTPSTRRSLKAFAAGWRLGFAAQLRLRRNKAIEVFVTLTRLFEKKAGIARRLGLARSFEKAMHVLHTQHLDMPETVLALHWSMAEMLKRYAVNGLTAETPADPQPAGDASVLSAPAGAAAR